MASSWWVDFDDVFKDVLCFAVSFVIFPANVLTAVSVVCRDLYFLSFVATTNTAAYFWHSSNRFFRIDGFSYVQFTQTVWMLELLECCISMLQQATRIILACSRWKASNTKHCAIYVGSVCLFYHVFISLFYVYGMCCTCEGLLCKRIVRPAGLRPWLLLTYRLRTVWPSTGYIWTCTGRTPARTASRWCPCSILRGGDSSSRRI